MRRAGALLLSAMLAGPALAEVAPGPPPWSCLVAAACGAAGCVPLPGNLASVRIEADATGLRLDGRPAPRFASVAEAEAAVASGSLPPDAAFVLVEYDGVADAVGFLAFSPSSRGGRTGLSDSHASLICTGGAP